MPLHRPVRPSRGSVNITLGEEEMPLQYCRGSSLGGITLHVVWRKCHYQITGNRVYGSVSIAPDRHDIPVA
jgi:hypothetical protein